MSIQWLDEAVQLHEVIEIHYYVDHYAAELYTHDGNRLILTGKGPTIEQALHDLQLQVEGKTLTHLRRYPGKETLANCAIRKL